MTATMVPGLPTPEARRQACQSLTRFWRLQEGNAVGHRDGGIPLEGTGSRSLGNGIGDDKTARVRLGTRKGGKQPSRSHAAAIRRERNNLDIATPWRHLKIRCAVSQDLEPHCHSTLILGGPGAPARSRADQPRFLLRHRWGVKLAVRGLGTPD